MPVDDLQEDVDGDVGRSRRQDGHQLEARQQRARHQPRSLKVGPGHPPQERSFQEKRTGT